MPFRSSGAVRYFQFGIFGDDLTHAVISRRGGVSPAPWSGLNLGATVGDDPERVGENRLRALTALGRDPGSVFDVWQVHGAEVTIAAAPRPPQMPHARADVILTNRPEVTLLMRFADCVPILLHDPVRRAAGLVHAGWMGTVRGTAAAAVRAMQAEFGSDPDDIRAGIGPSIGPDHYEVGPDVAAQIRQAFGAESRRLLRSRRGGLYLDLWAANALHLERAGIRRVEVAGLCTACHLEDWYSHRAEHGRTGRFGALIALGRTSQAGQNAPGAPS
jgi:YfiH family protein